MTAAIATAEAPRRTTTPKWAALVEDRLIPMPRERVRGRDILAQAGRPDAVLLRDYNQPGDVVIDPDEWVNLSEGNVFRLVDACATPCSGLPREAAKLAFVVDDAWEIAIQPDQTLESLRGLFDLHYGDQYDPKRGPITFHIVYTYPNADIYPHVLIGGVARTDKKPLGEGFQQKPMELGPFKGDATMVSRRSNHWDASRDTAAIKLVKVLDWIRSRT